ncbi:MAG: hypothetical protein A2010_18690 [Nitrospirae bacterium GWD2_57_9]|nr:MAG: hypothetical protein A2010_18690 [Nitrospirae bacterium GWD2_57_9]OGW50544.1 MAG: hypothetical protein A2078_10890 [Nitrospirae bacterium GWC2_57_9]
MDSIDCVLNGRQKSFSEILLFGLVKPCRRQHLCLGFRMEPDRRWNFCKLSGRKKPLYCRVRPFPVLS